MTVEDHKGVLTWLALSALDCSHPMLQLEAEGVDRLLSGIQFAPVGQISARFLLGILIKVEVHES